MVALFLFFFVIGEIVPLSPLFAAVLALAAISSAYQAEVIRGAIASVGSGQMVAARAVGMSHSRAIRSVILPQALRHALPPWSNIAASAVKNSSLVYALGIPELLRQAQYVSARTLEPFTAFGLAAVIYLVLIASMTWALRRIERRLAIPNVAEARVRNVKT
jgi:polar amino acid transport system permease protein